MSLTVKELRDLLNSKHWEDDAIITDMQNQNFIHIAHDSEGNIRLCTSNPIGRCNRTNEYVYPSIVKGYKAFCPELDEDLYEFEFTRINYKN